MRRRSARRRRYEVFADVFQDEQGFSTIGTAVAILLTCCLLFAGLWVARSESRAAGVQSIADSAALAAENEVAEFVIAVRVADATLLTLSLTGLTLLGVGTVCCCFPGTAAMGTTLIDAGRSIIQKRDELGRAQERSLNALQQALPATAQAQAQAVIAENASELDGSAIGAIELVPSSAPDVVIGSSQKSLESAEAIGEQSEELKEQALQAEEACKEANEALEEAWLHDCGNDPGYCMAQRASTLTSMTAAENPVSHSVNTWSFSMALSRAQAYYQHRVEEERPQSDSVEEQARSALRARFYAFAVDEVGRGYVHDDGEGVPDIFFPLLPRNTEEMKETSLYTEVVYPASGGLLHAYEGCPAVGSVEGYGSLAQLDQGVYGECETCGFNAVALGKVAAASSSIENGFEFHYRIVAEAARSYCEAKGRAVPALEEAKDIAGSCFAMLEEALSEAVSCRVEAYPPGRFGALAGLSFQAGASASASSFFTEPDAGAFAAVSAAALVEDEQENVLASLLGGVADDIGPPLTTGGDAVLGLWSSLLGAYGSGIEGISDAVRGTLDALPLMGASGLGTWASDELLEMLDRVGLQAANTAVPKPALANSGYVAQRGTGPLAEAITTLKGGA